MKNLAGLLAIALALRAGAPPSKELRFAMAGDPKTFDPLLAGDSDSTTIAYLTAGVLVRINRATDTLQPELAESWELWEGGRSITFHLRPGLRFSDGSPLTSADIVSTMNRALDRKQASPVGDTFRTADLNPEVTASSPRDVTIRYQKVKSGLDRLFDELPVSRLGTGKFQATAGPFVVSEYRAGEYVRLSRNPNYWKHDSAGRQLPYLNSIRIDLLQNRDIELSRFLRGELSWIDRVEPANFDRISKEKPAAAKNLGASLDPEFMWFNQSNAKTLPEWKRKWFTSAVFRHAVSQAIHRDDMVKIAFRGRAHIASGPISTANQFWFDRSLRPLVTDSQVALKSLVSEGFALQGGVLRDHEGHPVEFSLITQANRPARESEASLIQADLGKLGIKVNVVTLDFGSLLDRVLKSLDYEAALLGNHADVDPMEEMNFWLSSGADHFWWPSEKAPATPWETRIDQLELKQASESSRELRKKSIDEFQKLVVAQEPVIFLVNPDYLCAISPSLKGVQPAVAPPQLWWNIEWLSID